MPFLYPLPHLWSPSFTYPLAPLLRFLPPQVFCAGMQTEAPREYITLATGEGENFSEIFGFR